MSDLIDRQAAIDECYPVTVDGEVYEVVQVETLMGLPSAQPEIIRCKDCKFFKGDGLECHHSGMFAYEDDYCSNGERREDV